MRLGGTWHCEVAAVGAFQALVTIASTFTCWLVSSLQKKQRFFSKHLLIQSEGGDGKWETQVYFLLWPSLIVSTSCGSRHPGNSAEGQQVTKYEGCSNFLPFHSPKSTGSALYRRSVSAFQGCFYSKMNKDRTFGADLSLIYLPR